MLDITFHKIVIDRTLMALGRVAVMKKGYIYYQNACFTGKFVSVGKIGIDPFSGN